MPAEIDNARYISFLTYKRDGSPIATPVWVVPYENGYAFTTEANAYKVRRIRNDARASIAACDMRGKVAPTATWFHGAAVVLNKEQTAEVIALINKKYTIGTKLLALMDHFRKIIGKSGESGDGAIKVTLSETLEQN